MQSGHATIDNAFKHMCLKEAYHLLAASNTQPSSDPYKTAFSRLMSKIDSNIFNRGAVYEVAKLLSKYKQYLEAADIKKSTGPCHRLKEKLTTYYDDRIIFKKQNSRTHTWLLMANNAAEFTIHDAMYTR